MPKPHPTPLTANQKTLDNPCPSHFCLHCPTGVGSLQGSFELWVLLAIITSLLVLSLCWNILCCVGTYCTDRGKKFLPRFRRSRTNPTLLLCRLTSPTLVISTSKSERILPQAGATTAHCNVFMLLSVSYKRQDCYANLQLKVPKPASGRSSPQIQYSDVMTLPRAQKGAEPEEEPVAEADSASLHSDLYASVDSQRNKALANNEDYANHI
ncbi:hypothetical protein JZ751_017981 [Albula glossodonta]|uniref:Uncharacterized protein n=1 Tax=Albula glossodonta TaxID=121402 RepID=A0A8T2PPV6_9TELE|nr:hypothetical protein JZ751_017981 [Albula glossodonta]